MCGRYTLHKKTGELVKRYNLANPPVNIKDNFNVAPGHIMPVITHEDGQNTLSMMKWGFVPFWAKDPRIGYKMINARDDGIFTKPTWRSVVLKHRCLIPADGFFEWKKYQQDGKDRKQPFYIQPKGSDIFSFAGLYGSWKDAEGMEWNTYTIITTEPNKEMRAVHDRMPVILHKEDESDWLDTNNNTKEAVEPFLRPFEDNGLNLIKVSEDVNSTKNNNKELIYALED